jgi:hypothetical protein
MPGHRSDSIHKRICWCRWASVLALIDGSTMWYVSHHLASKLLVQQSLHVICLAIVRALISGHFSLVVGQRCTEKPSLKGGMRGVRPRPGRRLKRKFTGKVRFSVFGYRRDLIYRFNSSRSVGIFEYRTTMLSRAYSFRPVRSRINLTMQYAS